MRPEMIGDDEQRDQENQVKSDDQESFDVILRYRHGGQSEVKEWLRRQVLI
jgi:hypothetical protein